MTSSVTYLYQTDEATFDSADSPTNYNSTDYDAMLKGWIKFASDIDIEDGTECTISGTIVNNTGDGMNFVFGFVNANSNCENAIIDKTFVDENTLTISETFTYSNTYSETFFGFGFSQDENLATSGAVTIKDFYIAVNS